MMNYDYEINIDADKVDTEYFDDWGAAYLWLADDKGVEYNLAYDDRECCSAIYPFENDELDCTRFVHYEIDFTDEDWKRKLADAMAKAANELFEKVKSETIIMTIYADDTDLFTEDFCNRHNLINIEVNKHVVFNFFRHNILKDFRTETDSDVSDEGVFEEWLDEYTADDTEGLWWYAKRMDENLKVDSIIG